MHSGLILARADARPIYLQIMEQIRQRIAVGDWPPGHELPSIRQLATELRVSVITVKRAYLELDREGVIITRQGIGSTVAESPDLSRRLLEEELTQQLDHLARHATMLGLSEQALNDRVADAMRRLSTENP